MSKKKYLRPNDPLPEDVHWEWVELVKALQAACHGNNGFANLTVSISVNKNKPVLWIVDRNGDPIDVAAPGYKLLRISPKRLSEVQMTNETALALISLSN